MTEPSRFTLHIGCVLGVQPDKWQRRWQDNQPTIPTRWEFVDSSLQWQGLRDGQWDIVLARMSCENTLPQVLSYGEADLCLPDDLQGELQVVELYQERALVMGSRHTLRGLPTTPSVAELASCGVPLVGRENLTVPPGQLELITSFAQSGAGIAVLPEILLKAVGGFSGVSRPLSGEEISRVCAVWRKERPEQCPEELVQEFIGMLRGRRMNSARSQFWGEEAPAKSKKAARSEKINASKRRSQEARQQRVAQRHAGQRGGQSGRAGRVRRSGGR